MGNEVQDVKGFLEFMVSIMKKAHIKKGFHYAGMEDFVLREGQSFPYRELPKGVKYAKKKECFKNAMHLAYATGWTYCEGYAMGYFPTLHAWVIDDEGYVVDNTWSGDQPARDYYGVKMGNEFVFRATVKKKTYGLIDDIEQGYPLLKKKWKGEK